MLKRIIRVHTILVGLVLAILLALTGVVYPRPVAAGSAPGLLDCKSVARTGSPLTLKGEVPGDYEVFDLTIKEGSEEYKLKSLDAIDQDIDPAERTKLEDEGVIANGRVITLVEDFKRGVFTLALRDQSRYNLRLYALPSTIRARIGPNSKKATFDAMLLRGEGGKAIRMRCSFDHSI